MIATVITRGYGSGGSPALVVTRGYSVGGGAVIVAGPFYVQAQQIYAAASTGQIYAAAVQASQTRPQ